MIESNKEVGREQQQMNFREGFTDSSVGKQSACNAGDPGSIPGLGRSSEEGKGYPPQYSGLRIPWTIQYKDYTVQYRTIHAKSQTQLSDSLSNFREEDHRRPISENDT